MRALIALLAPCWPAGRAGAGGRLGSRGIVYRRSPCSARQTIRAWHWCATPSRSGIKFLAGSAQASAWARLLGRKGAFRTI